ncbi:MAG: twin-arginine translocase TatA/TatE family subunit [Candidatus Saccharimonadales bacterium]
MFGLGLPELVIILVILLLLFGAARLPKLARSVGESAGELQKGFQAGVDKKSTETKKDEKTQEPQHQN